MKNNKVTKWIFSLLTFLPMLAVGVMSLYTIFNKNAYQSYYGETINQEQYNDIDSQLELNNTYFFTADHYTSLFDNTYSVPLNSIDDLYSSDSAVITNFTTYKDSINTIAFANNGTTNPYVSFRQDNTILFNVAIQNKSLQFYFNVSTAITLDTQFNDIIYLVEYINYSYLDNAFEYSMSKFNDLGFDKVDFVGLFNDIFNSQYNVYTTFINCYLNYMLFVTLVTFVPRVLYWFINWSFGLVDKFTERGGM